MHYNVKYTVQEIFLSEMKIYTQEKHCQAGLKLTDLPACLPPGCWD